jgi:hypothetical protein
MKRKRRPPKAAPTMPERIKMLAPTPIVHDPPSLLGNVRGLLHVWPQLVAYPGRLAALLGVDEYAVHDALEALEVEGEVLS